MHVRHGRKRRGIRRRHGLRRRHHSGNIIKVIVVVVVGGGGGCDNIFESLCEVGLSEEKKWFERNLEQTQNECVWDKKKPP